MGAISRRVLPRHPCLPGGVPLPDRLPRHCESESANGLGGLARRVYPAVPDGGRGRLLRLGGREMQLVHYRVLLGSTVFRSVGKEPCMYRMHA